MYPLSLHVLLLSSMLCLSGTAQGAPERIASASKPLSSAPVPATLSQLLTEWDFSLDSASWQGVKVPHSCNAIDGHSPHYYRGKAYYRRHVVLTPADTTRPIYLLMEGAAQQASVYINGRLATHHMGGYTPFVVPLHGLVASGTNEIAITTDNHEDPDLIPVSSDFNKNNGLHNPVHLLRMAPVYFSPEAYGMYRLHVSTPFVSDSSAQIRVETRVVNAAGHAVQATLRVVMTDAKGQPVYSHEEPVSLERDGSIDYRTAFSIARPHLWQGTRDPYLYNVDLTLTDSQGRPFDQARTRTGLRYYQLTYSKGFLLNGHPYPLRGVAEHQDMHQRASAVTSADINRDYAIIKELGCNMLRLAHYPHRDYELRLCDSLGLIVQTEIPWVNVCGANATDRYFDIIRQQMEEMICNQYNHPSIIFWGMWNELDSWGNTAELQGKLDTKRVVRETGRLYDLAKSLDPWRLVGFTDCSRFRHTDYAYLKADYYSENRYNGWYTHVGDFDQFTRDLTDIHSRMGITNVAEYGAGINPYCHTTDTTISVLRNRDDKCHYEEYGNLIHESHVRQIQQMPWLNFTTLWILFDFPVANRTEGYIDTDDGHHFVKNEARKYINDKGLVTRDRQTKKDVFYLYKSWWNHDETTVHITSRRLRYRDADKPFYIKVYSNAPSLSLTQDGRPLTRLDSCADPTGIIWTFGPVKLQGKRSTFRVIAPDGTADEVTWAARKP